MNSYKIGSSVGLTGYAAVVDRAWRDGIELAAEVINDNGGILGKKIEMTVEDNHSQPQDAVVGYRKMISSDGVQLFDSGCVSAGNLAAASFVAQSKLPMYLCSIMPKRDEEQEWAFSFLAPPRYEMDTRYKYLKDNTDVRKVGILYDPTPYALMMKGLGEESAKDFGIEIVAEETYKPDDADLSVQLGRMKSAGAGAVLKIGQGGSTVTVAKNIKQLGLDDMYLLGSNDDGSIHKQAGDVLGDHFLFVGPPVQFPDELQPGPTKDAVDDFLQYLEQEVSGSRRRQCRPRLGFDDGAGQGGRDRQLDRWYSHSRRHGEGAELPGHLRHLQLLARPACRHHGEPLRDRQGGRRQAGDREMIKDPASRDGAPLLEAREIAARYGHVQALKPTGLHIGEGELVTVLGPNGAGKTTLLRALTRLVPTKGQVLFRGKDVSGLSTHKLARQGIVMVQEGRGLFAQMSVRENLVLGAYVRPEQTDERMKTVFELFPRLRERIDQRAGSLSGGEQQMLAIGRALMAEPQLLMLDEPSLGLAPRAASEILGTLAELNRRGLGILLVEQKAPLALKLARRVYVISLGSIVAELKADEIKSHHDLASYYLH